MNKLKALSQNLRSHLGRDSHGIELLDNLMRVANDQRTRVAALEKEASENEVTVSKLREERDAIQIQIANLKENLQSNLHNWKAQCEENKC